MLRSLLSAALLLTALPLPVGAAGAPADMSGIIPLDGVWNLTADRAGAGLAARWGERSSPFPAPYLEVRVPSAWERFMPGWHGPSWYERRFELPPGFGPRIHLVVGAANYRAEGWLNGKYVGSHEGGYTPFTWDLTDAARPGAPNRLVILVSHPRVDKGNLADPELDRLPTAKETWYYPWAGIWRSVRVEARPDPLIGNVAVFPNPSLNGIRIAATLAGTGRPFEGVLVAAVGERRARTKVRMEGGSEQAVVEFAMDLKGCKAWTPDRPACYRLEVALAGGGKVLERRAVTFGLRTVDMRDGVFLLNGTPLRLRGVLLQPNHPVGLAGPADPRNEIRDLEMVRAMGFNLVRAHLAPLSERQLEWCDLNGLLVYEETALAWMADPDGERSFQVAARELREMILAHRNHPSVAVWGISNENGRFAGAAGTRLLGLAAQLDPHRPAIDVSGWSMNIFPEGGWCHGTQVVSPSHAQPRPLEDEHNYLRAPAGEAEWRILRFLGDPERMASYPEAGYGPAGEEAAWHERLRSSSDGILVSEFGCGGLPDLQRVVRGFHDFRGSEDAGPPTAAGLQDERDLGAILADLKAGFAARGLSREFGSVSGFADACQVQQAAGDRRQTEALRLNPRVSGWILTQFNDVSWECSAGLVDPWRNPKRAAAEMPRLNAPFLLVTRPATRLCEPGGTIRVGFHVAADGPLPGGAETEYRLWRGILPGRWTGVAMRNRSGEADVSAPGRSVRFELEARLRAGRRTLSTARETLFARTLVPGSQVSFALAGDAPEIRRAFGPWIIPEGSAPAVMAVRPASMKGDELRRLVSLAARGKKVVFLELEPADLAALSRIRDFPLRGGMRKTVATFNGWFHYLRALRFASGLPGIGPAEPGRYLALEPYADLLPVWSLPEPAKGVVWAGCAGLNIRIMRPHDPAWAWGADIVDLPCRKGRILICQYRLLRTLETDPLARNLFFRLLVI